MRVLICPKAQMIGPALAGRRPQRRKSVLSTPTTHAAEDDEDDDENAHREGRHVCFFLEFSPSLLLTAQLCLLSISCHCLCSLLVLFCLCVQNNTNDAASDSFDSYSAIRDISGMRWDTLHMCRFWSIYQGLDCACRLQSARSVCLSEGTFVL